MACYTVNEAKELWDYAKERYLRIPGAHGYPDFRELVNQLSDDIFNGTAKTGMAGRRIPPEEVAKLLATPKTARAASKNLLLADRNRQKMLYQARAFVTGTEQSPLVKFVKGAYQAPYTLKVAYHSAALHMTHAWPYAFDPQAWKAFGPTWVDSWRAMSPSNARAIGEKIMLGSRFDQKVNSGLAVDPRKVYDDVQQAASYWGKLGKLTENSFMGLKELRDMMWDAIYDQVPEHLRTREMDNLISTNVNHMTGAPGRIAARALGGKSGEVLRNIFFAPSLDVARVMRPVDLLQAAGVRGRHFINQAPIIGSELRRLWGEASPERQWMARYQTNQWARIAGVYGSILFMNQMALKYFYGSEEDVNVTHVSQPDWGAVKAPDGHILQATGGETALLRMISRAVSNPKEAPNIVGNYLLGKTHPFLSGAITLKKGWGFGGEQVPAPFGQGPFTAGAWAEFLLTQLGPISTEEGIHEFSRKMSEETGMSQDFSEKFLKGLYSAALVTVPALLGTHYYKPKYTPKSLKGHHKGTPYVSP